MRIAKFSARTSRLLFVAVLAAVVTVASAARADLVAWHAGQTNPTSEGWTYTGSAGPPSLVTGPLSDAGVDAWQIDDNINASGGGVNGITYARDLTSAVYSDAMTKGWVLDFTLKAVDALNSSSMHVSFGDGASFFFDFRPSVNNQGDQCFSLGSASSLGGADAGYDIAGSGLSYQHYTVTYDPTVSAATVHVNGALAVSNWVPGGANDANLLMWTGSTRTGEMRVASLQFSTVPEPGTLMMVSTGLVGLLAYAWRRRK